MPRVAVEFENVTKTFRMRNRSDALRDAIPRLVGRFLKGRRAKEKRHVALDGVSFSVRSGEVLGVVGANGAGKSTTLRLAAGIYPPNSGKVRVDGRISALIALFPCILTLYSIIAVPLPSSDTERELRWLIQMSSLNSITSGVSRSTYEVMDTILGGIVSTVLKVRI